MFLAYTQIQLVLCKNATSLQTKHIVMVFSGAASSEEVQPSGPLLGQHLLLSTLLSGTVRIRVCVQDEGSHSILVGCCNCGVFHVLFDVLWIHV